MARHRHWFHAIGCRLGQFGRQDVHVHHCVEGDPGDCYRVLVGPGRICDPDATHVRKTLGEVWSNRENEGKPLSPMLHGPDDVES